MKARAEDVSVSVLRSLRGADSTPVGASRAFPSRFKLWKRRVVFAVAMGAAFGLRRLPSAWAGAVGAGVGRLAYRLDGRRAARARRQLGLALGLAAGPADRLGARSYAHLGRLISELARLPAMDIAAEVSLSAAAEQRLRAAVAEGRGVVLVTGHIGNWELLGQRLALAGFDGVTVVRRPSNPGLAKWIDRVRRGAGLQVIERDDPGAARRMLSALRRGAILGLLIDQRTHVASVDVPFFGRQARTPVAAAALALLGRRPVLVATIHRQADGQHHIDVERVPLPTTGARSAQRLWLTARLTEALERAIRRDPEQWVWLHDRWSDPD